MNSFNIIVVLYIGLFASICTRFYVVSRVCFSPLWFSLRICPAELTQFIACMRAPTYMSLRTIFPRLWARPEIRKFSHLFHYFSRRFSFCKFSFFHFRTRASSTSRSSRCVTSTVPRWCNDSSLILQRASWRPDRSIRGEMDVRSADETRYAIMRISLMVKIITMTTIHR